MAVGALAQISRRALIGVATRMIGATRASLRVSDGSQLQGAAC
jgi:hypothetical protein